MLFNNQYSGQQLKGLTRRSRGTRQKRASPSTLRYASITDYDYSL
jgi:hypothetical protein